MRANLSSATIYLYASNDPVIEASSGLTFAPFNIGYPHLREHAAAAELNPSENKWELIFDFSKGENHAVMPPSEWKTEMISLEGVEELPELVFDFPARYGGNMSDAKPVSSAEHDRGMSAFNIRTTDAKQAQAEVEAKEAA